MVAMVLVTMTTSWIIQSPVVLCPLFLLPSPCTVPTVCKFSSLHYHNLQLLIGLSSGGILILDALTFPLPNQLRMLHHGLPKPDPE